MDERRCGRTEGSMTARAVCCSCVGALFLSLAPAVTRGEQAGLPRTVTRLESTTQSHAFLASEHQIRPVDLTEFGYVEEEYLISGDARIFDWPTDSNHRVLARGSYTTRILVRRPQADAGFSGTAIVEALNPSSPVDLPIMWAESYRQFVADGHAWIGVTIKPNTIQSLKRFDATRYATLALPHPERGPTCAAEDINSWSQPTAPKDETGLAWDILSQVGALVKSERSSSPLAFGATRVYLTGQSQTAGYARTYATVFGRRVTDRNNKPLYDGYLYSGSPPWQVPLYQCAASLTPGDPRLLTGPAGVPVIELFAQGDLGTNVETRRADSDAAPDFFRRYEVAGAAHTDPWEQLSFASEVDMIRATGQPNRSADAECEPKGVEPSDFPIRYVFNSAWRNLDHWVREGVAPPRARVLALKPAGGELFDPEAAFELDEFGNAVGGVRTPYVDVPTARWIGAKTSSFQCMFQGYKYSFDRAKLREIYRSHEEYVAAVEASVVSLEEQRWLTSADAAAILEDAKKSQSF